MVRTTDSWVSSFDAVSRLAGLGAGSRVWVPGPLAATMNLFAAVHATVTGARLVDDLAQATHAHLTPGDLARVLGPALAGVTVVVAGDRLSPGLHDRAVAAGATVHHYYGAAELSFVAWGAHAEDLRPFPGVRVQVRDGEIWVRSPFVCDGYAGSPGPLRRDADGFATVGDHGLLADGRLVVLGRPDAVTTGGATVPLSAVEPVLRAAATGEVVVVGLPHEDLGAVLAVVLTSPGDHGPLLAEARRALAGAHRPRVWFHVADLPLTPAGKVDRAALVSLVSGADERATRLV
ncbi:AMP-binding protein [Nocardioides panacis]|uniref:AMP-binding protein n=1 Tax=Nocardioides panacis TaxID=2849501 RepID=A0A975T0X7_9ACTN|nr:AMP-binding protein [Nocardioides panacis]